MSVGIGGGGDYCTKVLCKSCRRSDEWSVGSIGRTLAGVESGWVGLEAYILLPLSGLVLS